MREIKFRVWDKEENKFLKPCFESEEDRYNKGMAMIHWNSEGKLWFTLSGYRDEDGNPYQLDAEIMQYTGLKDKTGIDIYEGDIIKLPYCNNDVCTLELEGCNYYLKGKNSRYELGGYQPKYFEVIGNIYENPELLKGE